MCEPMYVFLDMFPSIYKKVKYRTKGLVRMLHKHELVPPHLCADYRIPYIEYMFKSSMIIQTPGIATNMIDIWLFRPLSVDHTIT